MVDSCPECGDNFKNLAMHWYHSPEHRPEISQYQHEILTGVVMGDGHVNRGYKTPYIDINSISQNYLEYLDTKLGCLSTGVRFRKSGEENAKIAKENGFIDNPNPEKHSDSYWLKTRNHPDLNQYADWYSSGEKIWPEDIELTPTVLKHWYCGDGSHDTYEDRSTITISSGNEFGNAEKLKLYFRRASLPEPNIIENIKDDHSYYSIDFTMSASDTLWEYMGEPLPDFEYKWPKRHR